MSMSVQLPDELARRVEAVAAERGVSIDAAIADLLTVALDRPETVVRHLAFAAIGGSGGQRGAAQADELLAEGFGRD